MGRLATLCSPKMSMDEVGLYLKQTLGFRVMGVDLVDWLFDADPFNR